jgi:hypothetical protein
MDPRRRADQETPTACESVAASRRWADRRDAVLGQCSGEPLAGTLWAGRHWSVTRASPPRYGEDPENRDGVGSGGSDGRDPCRWRGSRSCGPSLTCSSRWTSSCHCLGGAHAAVPTEYYQPLLVAQRLPLPAPTSTIVHVVQWGLVLAASAAATGRAPRLLGTAVFRLYFEWMVVAMSYGKVDHDRYAFLIPLRSG